MDTHWHFTDPDHDWYHHAAIDGHVVDTLLLPVVTCPDCGEAWGLGRVLPITCPVEIREQIEVMRAEHVGMPFERFRRYAQHWEAVLRKYGHTVRLMPGDRFSPRLWDVPAIPRYDFFWPTPDERVVAARISRLFEDHGVSGISFRPVVLRNVGTLEPTSERQVPESGEMLDYFEEFSSLEDPSRCGEFFEMVVLNQTSPTPPTDGVVLSECKTCGRRTVEESIDYKRRISYYRKKKMLPRRHVPDVDIFWSHVFTGGFVTSNRVRLLLSDKHLRNCRLTRLTVSEVEI